MIDPHGLPGFTAPDQAQDSNYRAESAISQRCPISSVLIVRNTFSPVLFNVHAGTDFAQIASKASKLGNKVKQSSLKPAISLTHPLPPSWLYTYIIIIIHAHHKHNHGITHPLASINSTVTLLKLIPSIACNAGIAMNEIFSLDYSFAARNPPSTVQSVEKRYHLTAASKTRQPKMN